MISTQASLDRNGRHLAWAYAEGDEVVHLANQWNKQWSDVSGEENAVELDSSVNDVLGTS